MFWSRIQYGSNQKESARQKEDLRVLLEHFDAGQMDRYEAYRRSGLTKGSVRKVSLICALLRGVMGAMGADSYALLPSQLVNQVLGQSVSPNILTVVRGFAKVFVGEMVERGTLLPERSAARLN